MSVSSDKHPQNKVIETREIASLKRNTRQNDVFGDLPAAELEQLRISIKNEGLTYPIEILSDGTILDGHQRVRVCALLGKKKIRCWVRTDLEQRGQKACDDRFIEANLDRRQLSKLQIARCWQVLRGNLQSAAREGSSLRDFLASKFGCSGRNLDRWLAVLDAPLLVQNLCDAGKIKLVDAGKISRLPADLQAKLVRRLEKLKVGETPKVVVKEFFDSMLPKPNGISEAARRHRQFSNLLMSQVEWIVDTLKPQLGCQGVLNPRVLVPKIREAIKVLQGIIDQSSH